MSSMTAANTVSRGDRFRSRALPSTFATWRERRRLIKVLRASGRILQSAPNVAKLQEALNFFLESSGWFGRRVMASLLNEGNRDLLDSVLEAAAPTPGTRAVDVGFGGGYTLDHLAPLVRPERVAGVEISEAMISAVRGRCGDAYDLHSADAAALPFPDGSVDLVLSVNTIYFWPDPARVLAELHRVLRPGGRLLLGYRSRAVLLANPVTWFGFRLYGDARGGRMLEEAGFTAEIRAPRLEERIAIGTKA